MTLLLSLNWLKMILLLIHKLFFNLKNLITYSEVIIKNTHANITSTILVGIIIFSIVGINVECTSK